MTREQIIAEGDKMAAAQLTLLEIQSRRTGKYPAPDWEMGVLWAGLTDFSKVSADQTYRAVLRRTGEEVGWQPIVSSPKHALEKQLHANHADDLCIGQTWLDLYEETKDPRMIEALKARIGASSDFILLDDAALSPPDRLAGSLRLWSWCDALFMAPAVHARLSRITGDPRYVRAMHVEWERTSQKLYDGTEHLFFRDIYKLYPKNKTKDGHKIFWARGNGWVIGGLARTLEYIAADDPLRPRYETQLRDLATRLAALQRPDGTWSPSLLDYDEFPFSETSGTALNCFAIAWGINHGVLDEPTFRPVVEKAWGALLAARRPDNGLLGYVQSVAHGPTGGVYANGSRTYGTGAFLMAAAQLARLAPLHLPPAPTLVAAPPRQ